MPGRADVVLMGTTSSGKTFLIASLRTCARRTHGLAPDVTIEVSDESEHAGVRGTEPYSDADGNFTLSLRHAEQRAWSGRKVIVDASPDNFYSYLVRLSCTLNQPQSGDEPASPYVQAARITDTAGGVMLERPSDFGPVSQSPKRQQRVQAYRQLLSKARGIVFCYDVTETRSDEWINSFQELERNITAFDGEQGEAHAAGEDGRRRIAVAFTKTEYLFSLDGREAVGRALDRSEMIGRIRHALRADLDVLTHLRTLEKRHAGRIEVRCFPTSAFGYIYQNGCANYSHRANNWLIGDDNVFKAEKGTELIPDADFYSKFWRPLLTIDPFVYTVFGCSPPVQSKFMFTLDDLLGSEARTASPLPAGDSDAAAPVTTKAEASFFRILDRAGQKRRARPV